MCVCLCVCVGVCVYTRRFNHKLSSQWVELGHPKTFCIPYIYSPTVGLFAVLGLGRSVLLITHGSIYFPWGGERGGGGHFPVSQGNSVMGTPQKKKKKKK